ncbi:MAG: winged helix-turn-helix domain-containing protein [Candidatus Dojkabacteria bacterium]
MPALEEEKIWRITSSNIQKAPEIVNKQHIDLLCIETDEAHQLLLELLESIKKNRLKTKVLGIIPNDSATKRALLSYGCDDYICKPYNNEDLLLRSKKLINCIPLKYKLIYESNFLKYIENFNIVMYQSTYLPLTPREILIVKLLIQNNFVSKDEIVKYLNCKLDKSYSNTYISTVIHRVRKKIKLCTGRDLIRNRYGCGYYIL